MSRDILHKAELLGEKTELLGFTSSSILVH